MMEGYTTLGFLAAHTSTIRLGLLVTGVTYRHPAVVANMAATTGSTPLSPALMRAV